MISYCAGRALAASLAVACLPSFAQPLSPRQPLDEVVVTATRTAGRISDTVAEITVIDRAELERSDGQPLIEVLSREPGIQFSGSGGFGKTGSLFIRGNDPRHAVLLIDGVRVGSATTGVPSLDNLPMDSIERIEIVRGPMSSLYGSDAVGGVIQIFTPRGRQGLRPNARLTLGSNRFGQAGGGVSFGNDRFEGAAQLQAMRTDGISATNPRVDFGSFHPDRDGFRQAGGNLRLGARISEAWRIDGMLLESDGETQYDDGPGVDSRAKLRSAVQSLQANGSLTDEWGVRLIAARSIDRYETTASANPFFPLGVIETRQQQYTWENAVATPLGTALVLLERLEQDVGRSDTAFAVTERTIDAVGLGLSGSARSHSWQASVRNDRNSQFGNQTTGSLGWGYAFTPAWSAGASWGTSFVAPSFNQLYFPGFGNPTLEPEEGRHAELSLRWSSGAHSVRGAWFDNRIRGFITSGFSPVNVPRTRIDGVALSYDGRWKSLALGASLEHMDPRNETSGPTFGNRLPRRSRLAVRTHADWVFGAYSVGASWSAFSDRFDDTANTRPLPGYGTLDLRADWRFARDWTLGARVNNATDKIYETAMGFNQPQREVFVTLRYAPR